MDLENEDQTPIENGESQHYRGILADIFVFGGLGLTSYGAQLIHPAGGYLVFGIGMIVIGVAR